VHQQLTRRVLEPTAWVARLATWATLIFTYLLMSPVTGSAAESNNYQEYRGIHLKQLRVPIGGIGTGDILMGGRGDIQHIEVFNRPDRARRPIKTFFSIWAREGSAAPVAKVLERELIPPFTETTHAYVWGLPRFREVTFTNHFPFPRWNFQDDDLRHVGIQLEAFNPFVPLALDASSYPIAAFYWEVESHSEEPISLSIALNLENPIRAGKIVTESYHAGSARGLRFGVLGDVAPDSDGGMIVATTAPNATVQTHWYPGRWRDDSQIFWDDFSDDGRIPEVSERWLATDKPMEYDQVSGRNCSILVTLTLNPGEKARIPFYISWYFPRRVFTTNETFGIEAAAGKVFENYYSSNFSSEEEVLAHFLAREDALYGKTLKFAEILQSSSLPGFVKESLSTQAATLKSPLVQVTRDGYAHGFEGVGSSGWCCPGTCTHVWNYEQTLASLFPSLERSMREVEFLHNTFDNGFQAHRAVFPLGDYWFDEPPAADGQMGSIVRAYREWKFSGDTAWLRSIWPRVKKAIEFAWSGPGQVTDARFRYQERQKAWDPDRTGLLTGRQNNTYDISFFGPNSMTSSLYLAALKGCGEMARALGEPEAADQFDAVYRKGVKALEDRLWNGDYFVQIITRDPDAGREDDYELAPPAADGSAVPKYQYGDGCLADQLLGQYLAFVSGLGYLLDRSKVDRAVGEIYRNNFIREMRTIPNVQRVYAINDEAGLVLCSWPKGDRPRLPFVYSDEVWSGVEYQVAASLIYTGHVAQGLEVVKAVQDRYDGYRRNPFEHEESGVHYARALSSWAVLLALSGFQYDGVNHILRFEPKLNPNAFSSFWSTGNAWGSIEIDDQGTRLKVDFGKLELTRLSIGQPVIPPPGRSGVTASGNELTFDPPLVLGEGESLNLPLKGIR